MNTHSEYVRDLCLCRARHNLVYLAHLVMSSKVGERMNGRDFMPFSSTYSERSQEGKERVISSETSDIPLHGSQLLERLLFVRQVYFEVDMGCLNTFVP
jgi:hypothetical protein